MRRLPPWAIDAVWATGLLVLLALHFWFPYRLPGPAHDTYSTSADGKRAFFELMRTLHEGTVRRNHALVERTLQDDWTSSESRTFGMFCILGPERVPTDAEWDVLLKWVARGGHLVYAPRHDFFAVHDETSELEIQGIGGLEIQILPWETRRSSSDALIWSDVFSGFPDPSLTGLEEPPRTPVWKSTAKIVSSGDVTELVVARETVQAVQAYYGNGTLTVLASDWVFSNQSLSWPPNSLLAYRIVESSQASPNIVFDEYLNHTGVPRVMGLLLSPQFRPLTIQLLVVVYLYCWWQSRRFGPLLPPLRGERHNIVEHTDAVGTLHFRTRNGRMVVQAYLQQLVHELQLNGYPGREERVLEPLAVRLQTTSQHLLRLLRSIQKQSREDVTSRRESAEQIRRLARIRQAARGESELF